MFIHQQFISSCLVSLLLFVILIDAEWRVSHKRITAEYGSDLSLSCTFHSGNNDETIVQWLYQNLTVSIHRKFRNHWRPLFLNTQSLTPKETRYSIQQKIHQINQTLLSYSTILTLNKVTYSDEGLYMCKSLSPKTMQMTYQLRVIQSLDISPKQLLIPSDEIGQYSIELSCILKDNHTNGRHHDISWWHNNRKLGSQTNRYARIIKNLTQYSFISTLFYTGRPANVIGNYICESEPLRRYVSVQLKTNNSSGLFIDLKFILIISMIVLVFQ